MYDNFILGIGIDTLGVSMESRLLKAFITVAEELNFRKAADKLNITQPPLTRMITQLELDLEAKLFTRTTRSVELTGAGIHLLQKGRDILDQIAQLELEVRTLQKSRNGKLFIAFDGGALHSELPRIISSFKEQFPKISINVVNPLMSSIQQDIQSGKIDVFFGGVNFKGKSLIKQKSVASQELGVLVNKENNLSEKKYITLKDLYGETFIFHGKHEHLGFQEEFLEYLSNKNIKVNVYYKKSKESCGELVKSGKGLLLSTKKMANKSVDSKFIPLTDYNKKMETFATWFQENPSLPLKALVSFLEDSQSIPKSELDSHLS